MTQVSKKPLSSKVESEIQEIFSKLLVDLKSEKELQKFFNAFLSKTERVMLAKRILVLYLLEKGKSFEEIANSLNVTPATIAKLNLKRELDYDQFSLAFKKFDKEFLKESLKDLAKTVGLKITSQILKHARF